MVLNSSERGFENWLKWTGSERSLTAVLHVS